MMDRRRFLLTSLAGALAASVSARAQQARTIHKIGVLSAQSGASSGASRFLTKQLGQLGYVEGQNLRIEWRFADGNTGRLPELAADLVRLKVDVILAGFMAEVLAVKEATSSIPVVCWSRDSIASATTRTSPSTATTPSARRSSVVFTVLEGHITNEELLDHPHRLWAVSNLRPMMNHVIDTRGVTDVSDTALSLPPPHHPQQLGSGIAMRDRRGRRDLLLRLPPNDRDPTPSGRRRHQVLLDGRGRAPLARAGVAPLSRRLLTDPG